MPITTPATKLPTYQQEINHFENVLEKLFTPAVEKAGFKVIPPKSQGSNVIQADIIESLSKSDLVLCDMSILNANVFFEFGIRCALNKPIALVVDDKTENIPFDTGNINRHVYSSFPVWDLEGEIDDLAEHIKTSEEKSKGKNALWKHFGITESAEFKFESPTLEDKVDYIFQRMTSDKVSYDFSEDSFANLSVREMKILALISQGKTNSDIANITNLASGTVRNYVSSILSKLGVNNRAEAAAYAIENGLKNNDL